MDEVQAERETVVITERGKPVAKLVPINTDQDEIFGFLAGKGTVIGDVISPALTPEDWDLADGLAVSDMTLLEVGTLVSRGRIRLSISLESFLQEIEARFVVFPITGRACARAMSFPTTYPKDPADRLIGATALVEGLSLITADREIRRSKLIPTI